MFVYKDKNKRKSGRGWHRLKKSSQTKKEKRSPSTYLFFIKWAIYFCLFKQKLQFLQQINVKKCPSSKRCRDSNSQPSDYKFPPLTTRPGLPLLYLPSWSVQTFHMKVQLTFLIQSGRKWLEFVHLPTYVSNCNRNEIELVWSQWRRAKLF